MNKSDMETIIGVVTAKAPELRAAGVRELAIGEVRMVLAPPEAEPDGDGKAEPEPTPDAWNDPLTFGRSKSVPGKDPRKEQ